MRLPCKIFLMILEGVCYIAKYMLQYAILHTNHSRDGALCRSSYTKYSNNKTLLCDGVFVK